MHAAGAVLQLPGPPDAAPDYLGGLMADGCMSGEHVLTGSRWATAQTVAAAIACNVPVLLEGPAAGEVEATAPSL